MSVEGNEASYDVHNDSRIECRACLIKLEKESNMFNLFEAWPPPSVGMESTIADDLTKLANIQILETDRHSKVICEECCKILQNACKFVANVRKNDLILRQRFPQKPIELDVSSETVWPKPIQLDKNIDGSVYEKALDVEIKQEVLSEDEYNTNSNGMDEGYRDAALDNFDIKIEPEELIEQKPIQINGTISLNQLNAENSMLPNGDETYENEEFLEPPVKEEPPSEEEEEEEEDPDSVSSDLPLDCLLCAKVFKSVSGLKAHVIAQHSYKTVKRKTSNNPSPEKKPKNDKYVCATCRRTFVTSTDLMVHETCHNKAICYGCNQKFDTFDQLTKHRTRCKAINNKEVQKPKTLEDVKSCNMDRNIWQERKNEEKEIEKRQIRKEQLKINTRRFRQKLMEEQLEERRKKDRERYRLKKERGLIKNINELTSGAKKAVRKLWKENSKRYRDKIKAMEKLRQQTEKFVNNETPPDGLIPSSSRLKAEFGKKIREKNRRRLKLDNILLKENLRLMENRLKKYKMRFNSTMVNITNSEAVSIRKIRKNIHYQEKQIQEFLEKDECSRK